MASTDSRTASDEEFGHRVAELMAQADIFRRARTKGYQLGLADRRLLYLLCDGEPRSLREIAETLNLEQSTVNRQVSAAHKSGLLRRFRAKGEPVGQVAATEKGIRMFAEDRAWGDLPYNKALAELEPGDAVRFINLLERVVGAYGRALQVAGESPVEDEDLG